jgi:hypothetical protein
VAALSSPARTLGSWVQIPLKTWSSVFVLTRVQIAALRRADPPSKESYRLRKKIKNQKKGPKPNKGLYSHRDTNGDTASGGKDFCLALCLCLMQERHFAENKLGIMNLYVYIQLK